MKHLAVVVILVPLLVGLAFTGIPSVGHGLDRAAQVGTVH